MGSGDLEGEHRKLRMKRDVFYLIGFIEKAVLFINGHKKKKKKACQTPWKDSKLGYVEIFGNMFAKCFLVNSKRVSRSGNFGDTCKLSFICS